MKNKIFTLIIALSIAYISNSQTTTQIIRGKITDSESKFPLIGATVVIISEEPSPKGAASDYEGNYRIDKVSLGRKKLKISYVGYKDRFMDDIILTSAKEMILNIELEQTTSEMKELVISAAPGKGEAMNEMTLVSSRGFSVEETDRYAGSRGDPARMASNFAGVQGADDSRNDIVVRGNSPLGILWRVEGVDIPNPNHFSISGSSGGPVSIINNKILSNSDFYTGAFPAEFGNSVAGVFDLKLRNGNNEKAEYTGQFGFLGTELMAEGPISKANHSSYLIMYRYSTLSLFSSLGIKLGTNAVPRYQDLSFKFNFPLKKEGNISLWAISGKSDVDILISNQKKLDEVDLYSDNDRDQRFGTRMGIAGITYSKSLNSSTYLKSTFSISGEQQLASHDWIWRHIDASKNEFVLDSVKYYMGYNFGQEKISNATSITKKIDRKNTIKFGFNADLIYFGFHDSINIDKNNFWLSRWNSEGRSFLFQPYFSFKHKFTDDLVFSAGLHSLYFSINNTFTGIEPRAAIKWNFKENQSFSLGVGNHSQLQPLYTYYYLNSFDWKMDPISGNEKMGATKSSHIVLGYDLALAKTSRIIIETYYQSLYNVPVEFGSSAFSLINEGSGFSRFFPNNLKNTGTGNNVGLEFTLEKFFSKGYFFMITASLYDSKYKGSDNIERNTDFNGNYAFNALFGTEIKTGKKTTLGLGGKITIAGGKRYGIVDTAASAAKSEIIYASNKYNDFQFRNYFRTDLKINFKINANKVTHEIALDLVNILNTKNILSLTYAPVSGNPEINPIRENYQLGFLPIFYYKLDF